MSNYLTRIKNNQITDSTILANTKIVPGSIVGSLFNANLTVASDVTITGNLTVQGASTYLTVASTNTYVNDPLIVLNNAFTGSNTYDIGLIFNRGNQISTALIWNELDNQFEFTYTTETGVTYSTIDNSGFANLKVGNLSVAESASFGSISTTGDLGAANLTLSGDAAVNGGDLTTTAATFNLLNTNATNVNAFGAATTLIVGATTGVANLRNATTNILGNATVGGRLNVTGHVTLEGVTSTGATGTGNLVFDTSPILTTPNIGTPSFANLSNATNLPISTGVSGLAAGVADFLATPSSANLITAVTDETGTGNLVFSDSPVLTTPNIGTPSFATLTYATGLPVSTGISGLAANVATFLATPSSSNLLNAVTDETGTGLLVFATSPTLSTSVLTDSASFDLLNTTATTVNFAGAATTLNIGATTGNTNINNNVNVDLTLTARDINGTVIGNVTSAAGTFTNLTSTGNTSLGLTQATAINNTPLGNAIASTAHVTSLDASGVVQFTDSTEATAVGTGALRVTGGASIGANLFIGGNVNFVGSSYVLTGNYGVFYGDLNGFGALYAGVTGYTAVANTVFQTSADINNYAQNNFENVNTGNKASTDWVATAGDGDDYDHYINMGITTNNWDGTQDNSLTNAVGGNDGYLYVQGNVTTGQGGNLTIGASAPGPKTVKVIVGGNTASNITAVFRNPETASTTTTTGALTIAGGVGVSGNLNADNINATSNLSATDLTLAGDLAVNGGDITTTATTMSVFNANVTAVDLFGGASDIEFGSTSGTFKINNPTIVGSQTTQDVFNTNATTVNAFGAASTLVLGGTSGTANIRNATTNIEGNAVVGATLSARDINGTVIGNVTPAAGTFTNLTDESLTATRVTFAGTGGDLEDSANLTFATDTLTIRNVSIDGDTNTVATSTGNLNLSASTGLIDVTGATVSNIADPTNPQDAVTLSYLNTQINSGVTNLQTDNSDITITDDGFDPGVITTNVDGVLVSTVAADSVSYFTDLLVLDDTTSNVAVNGTLYVTDASTFNSGITINANSGDGLYVSNSTAYFAKTVEFNANIDVSGNINATDTTESISTGTGAITTLGGMGIAKNLNVGGNVVITGNLQVDGAVTTLNTATLDVEDLNITVAKGAASALAANGAGLTVDGAGATFTYAEIDDSWNVNKLFNGTAAEFSSTLDVTGDTTLTGDLAVNGGDLTTTSGTFNLVNANATTVNFAGEATTINIGDTGSNIEARGNVNAVGTAVFNKGTNNEVLINPSSIEIGTFNRSIAGPAFIDLHSSATNTDFDVRFIATDGSVSAGSGNLDVYAANSVFHGNISTTEDIVVTGDVAVNGGDLTTSAGTFNLVNANATTVNLAGAATTLIIGATTGIANIRNATTNILGNTTVGGTLDVTGHVTLEGVTSTGASGTGRIVFNNSPTLTTPNIGTPSFANLSNATNLPISTGISGLAAGVADFLATPSSTNLINAVTDETGTGNLVFSTSPILTTPNIGTPSFANLSNATGLPLTSVTGFGANVATFLATPTSSNLINAVTDETGTGNLVFSTSPTLETSLIAGTANFNLINTTATTVNFAGDATTLIIGSTTGVANIRNATTNVLGNATVGGALDVTGDTTITGDIRVNGGDFRSNSSSFNLLDTSSTTTIYAFGSATSIDMGDTSGTFTINNPTVVGTQSTQNLYNTAATTLNFAGAATELNIGATTGNTSIKNNLAVSLVLTANSIQSTPIGSVTAAAGTFTTVTDTGLTATRITYAGTGGLLSDSSDFTYDAGILTVQNFSINGATAEISVIGGSGNITLNPDAGGVIDATNSIIANVANPVNAQDVVTLDYLDTMLGSGINTIQQNNTDVTTTDSGAGHITANVDAVNVLTISNSSANFYSGFVTFDDAASNVAVTGTVHISSNTTVNGIAHITNTTDSTTTTSGALKVAGGAGIANSLHVGGNVVVNGGNDFTVGAELPGATIVANVVAQFVSNINSFTQVVHQNTSKGISASSNFVAIADNGSQTEGFINLGINSSTFNDPSLSVTGPNDGYLIMKGNTTTGGGNLFIGTVYGNDISLMTGGTGNANEVMRFNHNDANVAIKKTTAAVSSTSGALTVAGGVGINANLFVANGAVINSTQSNENFVVKGANSSSLILADSANNTVIFGGNVSSAIPGAVATFNSVGAIVLPVGGISDRPGNAGGTDVVGMTRYSTSSNNIEFFDGLNWQVAGSSFTVVTTNAFTGDGTTVDFELSTPTTTSGSIIAINGVVQYPTLAYSVGGVAGKTLTFTEAPAAGDIIDARVLITTTTVSALTNGNGYVQFKVDDNFANVVAGTSGSTTRLSVSAATGTATFMNDVVINGNLTVKGDSAGNINLGDTSTDNVVFFADVNSDVVPNGDAVHSLGESQKRWDNTYTNNLVARNIVADADYVGVGTSNIMIDTFDATVYRSAKYILSISNASLGEYETTEVLVTHNGTTAYKNQYGTIYTGSASLGTISVTYVSGAVELSYQGINSGNQVRIQPTYIKV